MGLDQIDIINSSRNDAPVSFVDEPTKSSTGLSGALVALILWVDAINNMQGEFGDLAASEATQITEISSEERKKLEDINGQIAALNPDKDKKNYEKKLATLQEQYSITQQKYDGQVTQVQTRMEAKSNFVSDLAKMTTGDYTNLSSICQISANLATDLK